MNKLRKLCSKIICIINTIYDPLKKTVNRCFLYIIICFEKKWHSREEKFHTVCVNLEISESHRRAMQKQNDIDS